MQCPRKKIWSFELLLHCCQFPQEGLMQRKRLRMAEICLPIFCLKEFHCLVISRECSRWMSTGGQLQIPIVGIFPSLFPKSLPLLWQDTGAFHIWEYCLCEVMALGSYLVDTNCPWGRDIAKTVYFESYLYRRAPVDTRVARITLDPTTVAIVIIKKKLN